MLSLSPPAAAAAAAVLMPPQSLLHFPQPALLPVTSQGEKVSQIHLHRGERPARFFFGWLGEGMRMSEDCMHSALNSRVSCPVYVFFFCELVMSCTRRQLWHLAYRCSER